MSVLARQDLKDAIFGRVPMITSDIEIKEDQIQMATVDCSVTNHIFRMKAAALPSNEESVQSLIEKFALNDFEIKSKGFHAEKDRCYITKLNEGLSLSPYFRTVASPKSTTGRLDTFVRVLGDRTNRYDKTHLGYKGPLYLEMTPLSFGIILKPKLELTQFRIKPQGSSFLDNKKLSLLHSKHGLLYQKNGEVFGNEQMDIANNCVYFSIDLDRKIVGFEARSNPVDFIDLSKKGYYDPLDFWIPIMRPKDGVLILEPGKFYLLATYERVKIPPECCAEMLPYDVSSGEFRSHYAGFFDNGFGGEFGTTGVLEVRVRDIPYRLVHRQRICRMVFEQTTQIPDQLYGDDETDNSYIGKGPSLPKPFKDREEIWEE